MQEGSRDRIIFAAGETFAERGYHRASLRNICSRAGVNVAMVKYHFGDKLGLYREVLHACFDASVREGHRASEEGGPRERLGRFVHAQLVRVRGTVRPEWYARLLAREMANPTATLDDLVARAIQPTEREIRGIVSELLGPGATAREITLSVMSVVSQSLHHHHSRHVIARLHPGFSYSPDDIRQIAEHITRFSLAALDSERARIEARMVAANNEMKSA